MHYNQSNALQDVYSNLHNFLKRGFMPSFFWGGGTVLPLWYYNKPIWVTMELGADLQFKQSSTHFHLWDFFFLNILEMYFDKQAVLKTERTRLT